jgi:hypothetical protein
MVEEFGVCVNLGLGLRTSAEEKDRCCRLIRAQVGVVRGRGGSGSTRQAANDQAALCLCAAFSVSDDEARAQAAANIQRGIIVLVSCGVDPTPGFACPRPLTG